MSPRSALVLDGASGPALATVRSLGRAGWRVLAEHATRSAASRYAAAAMALPDPAVDPDGLLSAVAQVHRQQQLDLVVPCTDLTAQLLHSGHELTSGLRVLGARADQALSLIDKVACMDAGEAAGFPVPPGEVVADERAATAAAAGVGYPCVLKPRISYPRHDGRYVHVRHEVVQDAEELRDAFRRLSEGGDPLVQALVAGRALAVGAVRHQGQLLGFAARETFSFHPVSGGTSVWKRTIAPTEPGVAAALQLLDSIGYEGLAEVEYQLEPDGTPRLMEIGVRAFGWLPLAMAAGADLPLLAAAALCGENPQRVHSYRSGVEMRWPAGELLRLRDAARGQLPAGVTRASLLRGAWPPWRPGMRYDGIVRDDLGPWVPARFRRSAPLIDAATVGAA